MMKLIKHLRPPANADTAPPAPPQEGTALLTANPGELPTPKPQPSWGALSKRLLGQLAAVETDASQPAMPSHGKTASHQR